MKRMRALNLIVLFLMIASAFLATPRPAYAAGSITITTTKDDGIGCTLREAIRAANTGVPYGDCNVYGLTEIYLQPGQYKLTTKGANENGNLTGDLDITSNLTIAGSGVSSTTGSWIYAESGFGDRIIHIKSPGSTKINVKLNNLAVKGGFVEVAPGGGGILSDNANVALYRVLITQNNVHSAVAGGGISNVNGSSMTVNQSTFYFNTSGFGGAIYNTGNLTVDNSLFDNNSGSTAGGGIDNNAATTINILVRNSTFSGNSSIGGSAIANSGNITVINATIANNAGSAALVLNTGSQTAVRNTIIARHNDGPNCMRVTNLANFASNGYNLTDANSHVPENVCTFSAAQNDQTGVDPLLTSSVDYYDSPTKTYGFTSTSSPAIDKIPWGSSTCPLIIDQRLHGRGADGDENPTTVGCDIGAYEEGGVLIRNNMPFVGRQ